MTSDLARRGWHVLKLILLGACSLAVVAYLVLGIYWYQAPVLSYRCELTVETKFPPRKALIDIAYDWIAWPLDVESVRSQGQERGLSMDEIRLERFCPSGSRLVPR